MAKRSTTYSDTENTSRAKNTDTSERDLDSVLTSLSEKLGSSTRSETTSANRSETMGVSLESFFEEATRGVMRALAAHQEDERAAGRKSAVRTPTITLGIWIDDGSVKDIFTQTVNPSAEHQ